MIPPFDNHGHLPPGIHPATLDEIDARFGRQSEIRVVQMQSVHWMVELAAKAGVSRIALNGSFVTDIMEPNDVDCALLFLSSKRRDVEALEELKGGLPFLDIAIVDRIEFDEFVGDFFAADRANVPKGMVEVIAWN